MKRIELIILSLLAVAATAFGQQSQTVKGKIIDTDSRIPMPGVTVTLETGSGGAISDENGFFKIENVEVGRHTIRFTYLGYETLTLPNIVVTSGKETYIPVELTEKAANIDGVVVKAQTRRLGSNNEMATLSSRTFNAEEAERYPGSRQDPARMASNYAGVQGTDDSRNDIVVRGNSPLGLLWRFEGIDIPNPSHFSIAGSTGGPLSILNNKVIGHSDFMTGAFAGEYGNALSGVFDIRMRTGNREKNEYTAQIGLLGMELMAEGPINKETGSSFLATYRYSTLAAFKAVNFNLGTSAIPAYQDASFKLNFPMKNNRNFSVWGIGGLSDIDIIFSDDTIPTNDLYGENDRNQYFSTNMFTVGATYSQILKNEWTLKAVIAQSGQEIIADHDFLIWDSAKAAQKILQLDTLYPVLRSRMYEGKTALHLSMNKKFSARSRLKLGFMGDVFKVNYLDSSTNEYVENWVTKLDANEFSTMLRLYASHKFKLSSKLTLNSGLHLLYFQLGSQMAAEPRLGLNYVQSDRIRWSLAYGMHSRMQPMYILLLSLLRQYIQSRVSLARRTQQRHWADPLSPRGGSHGRGAHPKPIGKSGTLLPVPLQHSSRIQGRIV